MKRITQRIVLLLVAFIAIALIIHSCTKENISSQYSSKVFKNTLEKPAKANMLNTMQSSDSCGSCGGSYSGSHSGIGSYVYTPIQLDLTCADSNSTITVACTYYDVPDAFDILDKNGSVVVTTGWKGNANCPGPWGQSINTLQAETDLNFTYNPSLAPYKLRVQTAIIGCSTCGSNNVGCTSTDDTWYAGVSCAGRNDQQCTTNCVSPLCGSCSKWFTGTHSGIGSYVYTPIQLDLSCAKNNSIVTLGGIFYDVPNVFDILDKNNNVVTTTGWIGNANCSGPWGSSINTLQAETYITFTYNSTLAPYKLRVQTAIIGCSTCGPNNTGCTSTDDTWGAGISCIEN